MKSSSTQRAPTVSFQGELLYALPEKYAPFSRAYAMRENGQLVRVPGGSGTRVGHVCQPTTRPDGLYRVYSLKVARTVQEKKASRAAGEPVGSHAKTYLEHRVRYEVLVGEIPEGWEVDHIDGNKLNNALANLHVLSRPAHIEEGKRRNQFCSGERNGMSKFSWETICAMRRDRDTGLTYQNIANKHGCSTSYAWQVCNFKRRVRE